MFMCFRNGLLEGYGIFSILGEDNFFCGKTIPQSVGLSHNVFRFRQEGAEFPEIAAVEGDVCNRQQDDHSQNRSIKGIGEWTLLTQGGRPLVAQPICAVGKYGDKDQPEGKEGDLDHVSCKDAQAEEKQHPPLVGRQEGVQVIQRHHGHEVQQVVVVDGGPDKTEHRGIGKHDQKERQDYPVWSQKAQPAMGVKDKKRCHKGIYHPQVDELVEVKEVQFQEETSHAVKILDYVLTRQGEVKLEPIAPVEQSWSSLLNMFEEVYRHENLVTDLIGNCYEVAVSERDHATASMLQWFIDEQTEEESNASEIIDQIKLVGEKGEGIYHLDKLLATRVFVDSTKTAE